MKIILICPPGVSKGRWDERGGGEKVVHNFRET